LVDEDLPGAPQAEAARPTANEIASIRNFL
jgi:hypothetical protein